MNNLVGRSFVIADGRYRIVDVRRTGPDAMVYAERLDTAGNPGGGPAQHRASSRTAFHYGDIAPLLEVGGRP